MAVRRSNPCTYYSPNTFGCQRITDRRRIHRLLLRYAPAAITGVRVPEDHELAKLIHECCEIA
jgi:hypothetical protein